MRFATHWGSSPSLGPVSPQHCQSSVSGTKASLFFHASWLCVVSLRSWVETVSVLKCVYLGGERHSEKERILTYFFIKIILKSTTMCLLFSFYWKIPLCWKRQKEKGTAEKRWLDNITDSMDMNLSKFREIGEDRGAWHAAIHAVTKSWTRLSN